MPVGIEPSFCPICSGAVAEFREMPKDEDPGVYWEDEDDL